MGAQPREEFYDDLDDDLNGPLLTRKSSSSQDSSAAQEAFWNDQKNYGHTTSDPIIPTQDVETQLVETQPVTQSTQPADEEEVDAGEVPDEEWNRLVSATSRPIDVPRNKRARYIHILKEAAVTNANGDQSAPVSQLDHFTTPPPDIADDVPTQVLEATQALEETQLADETETAYIRRRGFLPPRTVLRADSKSDENIPDAVDVVPDSEPVRGSPMKTLGTKEPSVPSTSRSSGQKRKRSLLEDDEVIPDSTEAQQDHVDTKGPAEDEDEDDIPLAAIVGTEGIKLDATVNSLEQMPPPPLPSESHSARSKGKEKANTPMNTRGSTRKKKKVAETADVSVPPSSVPDETPAKAGSSSKSKSKKKTPAGKQAKDTPTTKRRRLSGDKRASGSKIRAASEFSALETATELAPEDAMEVDEIAGSSTGRSTRRKNTLRSTSSNTPGLVTRAGTSGSIRKSSVQLVERTRVFALWKQDAHYYPGTVKAQDSKTQAYTVVFDDLTEKTDISLEHMRVFDLRSGDSIVYGGSIIGIVDRVVNAYVFVTLAGQKRAQKILLRDVLISSKTINSEWEDRKMTNDMIKIGGSSRKRHRSSSVSTHISDQDNARAEDESNDELDVLYAEESADEKEESSAVSKSKLTPKEHFLRGCGVIATFSAGLSPKTREEHFSRLRSTLAHHGGQFVSDWHHVLHLEGRFGPKSSYWYIERKGAVWKDNRDIRRLYLMADEASQKSKFLFALAIGVPCLSLDWLFDEDESRIHEWNRQLLPQGYSDHFNARISQSVDVDWGNSPCHLKEIMDNPVPPKLFAGLSILCLGPEIEPDIHNLQKTSGIPHIVLGMGAERVEFAMKWRLASKEKLKCDYIIIGRGNLDAEDIPSNDKVVPWNWVKQCLISGRMLPRPEI
ncbi:hypothetical protein K435DRAFT_782066 [Dendrothele bispora CBS 962.96]|uniref:BRCT domain-containing protein n=1 Tax=Dendrothele bispora (strain CBS 962.96) TaxID=1314807 RepID=A0A4S8LHZ4_DENBC|nr:hypothetical protein K435DRAFT_782066 [Dendrothele bispora CBS 962.96]